MIENRLLIIGSGMFVNGRNSETRGVIIPSIFEFLKKTSKDFEIYLTYRSSSGKDHNLECCDFLNLDDLARVHHIKPTFSPDDIKSIVNK